MNGKERASAEQTESQIIRTILEGTSGQTGGPFLRALVKSLALSLQTSHAWVTEYIEEPHQLRALAFWGAGEYLEDIQYDLNGTPCDRAIRQRALVHFPDKIIDLFPDDKDLVNWGAVSYMGAPLMDDEQTIIGHLAVLHTSEMPYKPELEWVFRIFAARAGAEIRRIRAESALQQREEQLRRLFDSTMDAVVQVDSNFIISQVNNASERIFGEQQDRLIGQSLSELLSETSWESVRKLAHELADGKHSASYMWIPERLEGRTGAGERFPAEGTLSTCEVRGATYFTLVLRNVLDQVEANRRIHTLTGENNYLQEELNDLRLAAEIIGDSPAMQAVLREVKQVATTDATVLLQGQTGTGKEMIARAIHMASRRADHLMVTVNCAAIPANLIESELFGHEKGAFTGATQQRKGRFALADGGTIFLDEIGELPYELQAKLLRVLQERAFEPVGSARTQRADVRIIAATNRDLKAEVTAGRFREDLYYRINVFPILLPPLRERGEDVLRLADSFASRFARRMAKSIQPIDAASRRYLLAYDWPGNVRELQNVIERAVITSPDGYLRLNDLLSAASSPASAQTTPADMNGGNGDRILTSAELLAIERNNILRALEQSGWKIAGAGGAASLLGMKPSTLSSRIAALGLKRD